MAKIDFESFETSGEAYDQKFDRTALIKQIEQDIPSPTPSSKFKLKLSGTRLVISYHCIETYLSDRSRVESLYKESEKLIKDYVKEFKKEYKKRSKKALKMTEVKEGRDYSVEKWSLNERYYFTSFQVYDLKEE